MDTKRLRELAEAATPGEWEWSGALGCDADALKDGAGGYVLWPAPMCDVAIIDVTPQNRAYIAAANPAAILALLDRLELAEAPSADEMDYVTLCALLPHGASWGGKLTPKLMLEIVAKSRAIDAARREG